VTLRGVQRGWGKLIASKLALQLLEVDSQAMLRTRTQGHETAYVTSSNLEASYN
jgi:hypothetical protein